MRLSTALPSLPCSICDTSPHDRPSSELQRTPPRSAAHPNSLSLSLALAAILFLPPLAEAATFPEKVQGFFCRYVIECPQEAPPAARPVAPPAPQPAPTPVIQTITQPVIERVIETRVIAAQPQATEHLLNERLLALTNDLDARLAAIAASAPSQRQTEATHESIARAFENLAESLARALTTLSLTVTETLTAATAVIQSLTAATATVTDDLTVGGTLTANILTVQGITSQGALIGPYVTATSTTATSTFAGGIAGPGDFTVLQDGRVGIGVASPLFYKLQIQGSSTVDVTSKLHNLNANGYASQMIGHDGRALYLDYYNASYSGSVTDSLFESSHATVFAGSSAAGLNIAATNATSDLKFYTGGYNPAQMRMRIDANGNVGIGTTSPSQKLHIGQVTDATNLVQIDSTQVGVQGILLNNPAGSQWIIGKGSSRPSTNGIGFKDEDAGTFPFWIEDNAPSNALYVKSTTGNVGIGTSTPANTLVVNSGNTGEGITITHNNATARQWKLFSGIGGVGHPNFAIADGSNIRLAINNAGNIGIGTTNPNDAKLEVKGGTVCVDTDSDDSATSCIASESDERLKTNIQALSASTSLDIINALNPVSFDWRASDPTVLAHWPSLARYAGHERSIGLIAQEVMPILPEALSLETVGDDTVQYYQLDYTKFIPHLIGAIKELGAKLSALADAVGGFAESFTSKELHAVNRLCIGATCITESDLQDLLHMRSQAAGAGAAMPTSVPESESEPAAEPAGDALTEPEEEEAEEEGDGEDADEGGAASAAPQD